MNTYVCFGEVLWDVFPDFKRIGGAPLNVASRLAMLGNSVEMISSVGDDEEGKGIQLYMESIGLSTSGLQISNRFETGSVQVSLDEKGVASYEIKEPVAWDDILLTDNLKQIVGESDTLVYGSLVCRNRESRQTLGSLLPMAGFKVFDVNLRPPNYDSEVLDRLMSEADFVKFNDEELAEIAGLPGGVAEDDLKTGMGSIAEKYDLDSVCVTLGAKGALLLHQGNWSQHRGFQVRAIDTVGAGDSFLATLLHYLNIRNDPRLALEYACAMGAMVALEEGANPLLKHHHIINFIEGY